MFEQYTDQNIEIFPAGKTFRICFDNVLCKWRILATSQYDLHELIEAFSVENPTQFFSKSYGYNAESRLYAINKFGYFPLGLIFEVLKYIKLNYGSLDCVAMSSNAQLFLKTYLTPLRDFISIRNKETFQVSNISEKYQLRDYQTNAIKAILFDGYGRGLIELPTGSGKSFVIANFIYTLQQQYDSSMRYLIFVPNRQLVEQFYKDLLDYGYKPEDITRMSGGIKKKDINLNAKIIIGNRQYLFNHAEELPKIDVLIADEAHTIGNGSSTYKFVENINCKIKVGCSGTLPRTKFARWSLVGLFSKVFYQENVVSLQNKGFLSKLKIKVLSITDKEVEDNKDLLFNLHPNKKYSEDGDIAFNESYINEIDYINKNYEKLYSPVFNHLGSLHGNILILFDRLEFGKNMFEFAKELKPRNSNVFYVDGSIAVSDRENIRSEFEKSSNNILFAQTTTFSTGINIKNLENVVFMFNTKSASKVIQSIGRSLRLHENKESAVLYDIVFNTKYSRKHFKERMKLYKEFYNKDRPDEVVKISI